MNNPLHAAHYADSSLHRHVEISANETIAADTCRVRFQCPEIAAHVVPGQFVMIRFEGVNDPLIGRPFAVFDILRSDSGEPDAIDLIYHVRGKFTQQLARARYGQLLDVWGPLGNGFPVLPCRHLIMVAGGVGQTPFLILAKEHLGLQSFGQPTREVQPVDKITLCYGAATADRLASVDNFQQLEIDVRLATDDGSAGRNGLVTDELQQILDTDADGQAARSVQVVCCGPEAMMQTAARITAERDVPCLVSLETPMACGIGICFTCVAKIHDDHGESDYRRTCVEGPVFDAKSVEW